VAAMLLLGVSAPAQAAESSGSGHATAGALAGVAGKVGAVDRPTRVIAEARDSAEGVAASTESSAGSAVARLDDGVSQVRERVSGTAADASATVQATASQLGATRTRVAGIVRGGARTRTSNEQDSPAGHSRREGARESTGGSSGRDHRRDRETDAGGPEREAVATSSTAPRTEAEERVTASGGTRRAPSRGSTASAVADLSAASPLPTARGSSAPSRSDAEPLAIGERLQVARTASSAPLATPSNDRRAPGAAWVPAPGSAAGFASLFFAFLMLAGMLRPFRLGQRLSPFPASAAAVPFLASLERPG